MEMYTEALRRAVRPGDIVLDMGAGTGIFSLLACKFGASQVHAVEPDEAIQVARDSAKANGFADRIAFHQTISTSISLPEAVNVIISDLRSVLPLFEHHIPSIVDARRRLLVPGGALIPCRDMLWGTLVEDPKRYRSYHEPWLHNAYDLDLSVGKPYVVNTWRRTYAQAEQLLVPPQQWATLDYTTIESPHVAGEVSWKAERAGTAHGLLLWFDTELAEGIGFSNAPGRPELIYGQAFFPLQNPVELSPGDTVSVKVKADLADSGYIWRWQTEVRAQDDGSLKANYSQSTFFGQPVSLDKLRKKEANFRPTLDKAGQADQFMLSLMDGSSTLNEIAERAWREYPAVFAGRKEAFSRVSELSTKYAR